MSEAEATAPTTEVKVDSELRLENVTVELPNGTYRLPHPLTYTAAEAGRNGHTITWEAAPGAHPVLSGAQ